MLEIKNLQVKVAGKEILKGIDLSIGSGEVHAVMGPNGSGKTTLAQVLAGRLAYEVTGGTARFQGKDLLAMKPEDRAREGVFMAFQYPVEIPGVSNAYFLKAALNAIRKYRGLEEIDAMDFMGLVQDKAKLLGLDETFMKRGLNEGFSGGEKKKNEVFQMAVLEPKFCILDETDSGLDIDALRLVANGINTMRSPTRSMLVVTHYQRLLRGRGLPHPEARGLEVHEPRAPPSRAIQARDSGPARWRPGGAPRTLLVRRPEDESPRVRERAILAPPLLPASAPGGGTGRLPRRDPAERSGERREGSRAACEVRGRRVRCAQHVLLHRRRLHRDSEGDRRGGTDSSRFRLDLA